MLHNKGLCSCSKWALGKLIYIVNIMILSHKEILHVLHLIVYVENAFKCMSPTLAKYLIDVIKFKYTTRTKNRYYKSTLYKIFISFLFAKLTKFFNNASLVQTTNQYRWWLHICKYSSHFLLQWRPGHIE